MEIFCDRQYMSWKYLSPGNNEEIFYKAQYAFCRRLHALHQGTNVPSTGVPGTNALGRHSSRELESAMDIMGTSLHQRA